RSALSFDLHSSPTRRSSDLAWNSDRTTRMARLSSAMLLFMPLSSRLTFTFRLPTSMFSAILPHLALQKRNLIHIRRRVFLLSLSPQQAEEINNVHLVNLADGHPLLKQVKV